MRAILDEAARDLVLASKSDFPLDLISIVEQPEGIERLIREHDEIKGL